GDGTFRDISRVSGISVAAGGCSVAFTDYNKDGFQDILVGDCALTAQSPIAFQLYSNNGDMTFTDVANDVGLNPSKEQFTYGAFRTSIAFADYDGDGDEDLFVTGYGTPPGTNFCSSQIYCPSALFKLNDDHTFSKVSEVGGTDLPNKA